MRNVFAHSELTKMKLFKMQVAHSADVAPNRFVTLSPVGTSHES